VNISTHTHAHTENITSKIGYTQDSVLTVQCRWVTGSLLFTANVFDSEGTSNHHVHKMSIIFFT